MINVGEGGGVIIVSIGEDDVNGEINVGEGGGVIIVCIGEDDVNGEINVGEGGVWNKTGGGNVSATQEAGGGITVSCKVSISQRAWPPPLPLKFNKVTQSQYRFTKIIGVC